MTTATQMLSTLRRPRLLVRAAQIGLEEYDREACLRRLMPLVTARTPATVFSHLWQTEATLNAARVAGEATYVVARHVEVLIALIAEARLVAASETRQAA